MIITMSTKEYPPQQQALHIPVLLGSTLELLAPHSGEKYLDLTAGYGGHASRILGITGNYADSVLVDRDDYAISHLAFLSKLGSRLIHADFVTAAKQLIDENKRFDIVLVDLGVSSPQLDQSNRGFSFTHNGPLDMRMDRRQKLSAEDILNKASLDELIRIIHLYGEEPIGLSRTIAKSIIKHRPLKETQQLASLVAGIYRGKRKRTHPATRTFQAFRIVVNDELGQIETLLPLIPDLLNTGGRVGVISFHSLEDRLVKNYFKEQSSAGFESKFSLINKKPIAGSISDVHNPQSRSAKLRVAVKK